MFPKPLIAIALIASSTKLVAATPPACLLAAVNTEPNPADLKAICGPDASKVQSQIRSQCGSNSAVAMSAFSSICSSAGHDLATKSISRQVSTKSIVIKTDTTISASTQRGAIDTSGKSTVKNTQSPPTLIMTASGHAHGIRPNFTSIGHGVTTPTAPTSAPSGSGSGIPGSNAAGRIETEGLTALALAAAGLAVFL